MANTFNVEQLLISESGRIGPEIRKRILNTSAWLKLPKMGKWTDEMGTSISVMTSERSLPTDVSGNYVPPVWTAVGENAAGNTGSGTCAPSAQTIKPALRRRSYQLQMTALESTDICVNDLRFAAYRKQVLANMMQNLSENTAYLTIERNRDEYTRVCENKVVLRPSSDGSCPTTGGRAITDLQINWFPLVVPTSQLTDGLLKKFYMSLIRNGGGINPLDRENGRPVFGLICSSETSDQLLKSNDNIRNDFRWSSRVNELLTPLGVERSFNGFFHLNDDFPPRWNFTGGAWVRVYPYKGVAADISGTFRMEIDPAYESALYEDSYIYHTDVLTKLVPNTITSPGGGTSFDAQNYSGDWKWNNIKDRGTNPDGTIGYFRGVFQDATEPGFPQYGIAIRHLRCQASTAPLTCS